MHTRRLIFAACVAAALGALVLFDGAPGARADGIPRSRTRTVKRRNARPAHAARGAAAMNVAPVPLLDAAGVQQLFARTPPQDRPLLVNFWATWCEPCRIEFPDLVKLDADYRARGLDFAAISVDDPAEATRGVPKFLRQMRAQMPAYVLNVTDSEPVINAVDPTWGGELPATFLFDRRGQIVFKHKGRIQPAELRAAIEKLLAVSD